LIITNQNLKSKLPELFIKTADTFSRFYPSGEPIHDTWIELNLPNMAWNLKIIKQHIRVPVMAVIKANAYGHGLLEVGRFLDKSGIDALMVCKLSEAIQLRESEVTRIICDSNSE
jgi:alanine racemase